MNNSLFVAVRQFFMDGEMGGSLDIQRTDYRRTVPGSMWIMTIAHYVQLHIFWSMFDDGKLTENSEELSGLPLPTSAASMHRNRNGGVVWMAWRVVSI